jgi:hypothetical protein
MGQIVLTGSQPVMAASVLSLATNQPLPEQGLGIRRLYLIFDLVILALTIVLVLWLARIPGRHRRLAQRGIVRWSSLVWRTGLAAVVHFAWPLVLLYLALNVPAWKVLAMMQPDLSYWLEAVAMIVFLKGVLEISLAWRVFRQTHQSQTRQSV